MDAIFSAGGKRLNQQPQVYTTPAASAIAKQSATPAFIRSERYTASPAQPAASSSARRTASAARTVQITVPLPSSVQAPKSNPKPKANTTPLFLQSKKKAKATLNKMLTSMLMGKSASKASTATATVPTTTTSGTAMSITPPPTAPATPGSQHPKLNLLPTPSTMSTEAHIFKNDAIFKIKSTEAYLAPADHPEHLSFRKGQAFYALNHNDELKCFFVSTEYATPFSRTAVNGFVPDKYFEVVELNTGKNKTRSGSNPPAPATKVASTTQNQQQPTVPSTSNVGKSANSSNAIAAMQREHELMMQQHQQYPAPVINKHHSFSSSSYTPVSESTTPAPAAATTPITAAQSNLSNMSTVNNHRSHVHTQQIAELERELRNADFSIPNAAITSGGELSKSKSRSREMLRFAPSARTSNSNLSGKNNNETGNPIWNGAINSTPINDAQVMSKQPSNPVALPTTPIPTVPPSITHQRAKSNGSFFRMLFSSSSSLNSATSSPLPDHQSSSFRILRGRQSPQQLQQPTVQASMPQPQLLLQPVLNISTARARRVPSYSTMRAKSPANSVTNAPSMAAPKTPRTPFAAFFPRLSARTPQAPTGVPSAMPYFSMRSPSANSSVPGSPSSIRNGPWDGTYPPPPPMPEIPAEYLGGSRAGSITSGDRAERRKSHGGVVGNGGSIVIGGVTAGRMKSSLKKSTSSFLGGAK
ncbi:hypothetical protein HK100_006163 [Physocladia obscura]|uniref:Uncharacterized protein n=1 Tax=Physocladia obscura TaxID=109957 RepID=A0AAD5XG84_9FUNG|nr:hypothetical protein HK100_006163 [Physocladia obscura]